MTMALDPADVLMQRRLVCVELGLVLELDRLPEGREQGGTAEDGSAVWLSIWKP